MPLPSAEENCHAAEMQASKTGCTLPSMNELARRLVSTLRKRAYDPIHSKPSDVACLTG